MCQRDSTENLQSSLEARSTDPVKAFESLNALPVAMEVDELSGREALGTSLFNHFAKVEVWKGKAGKSDKTAQKARQLWNFGKALNFER